MAYASVGETCLGSFVEREFGHTFEFSANDTLFLSPPPHGGRNIVYPHKVWVGGVVGDRWRHALVKGSVAYVVVDEVDDGVYTVQKWDIKNRRAYHV